MGWSDKDRAAMLQHEDKVKGDKRLDVNALIGELNSDPEKKASFLKCLGVRPNVDVMPYSAEHSMMFAELKTERENSDGS